MNFRAKTRRVRLFSGFHKRSSVWRAKYLVRMVGRGQFFARFCLFDVEYFACK